MQTPAHSAWPGGQSQAPVTQVDPPEQGTPQPPQCVGSLATLTHTPPQSARPARSHESGPSQRYDGCAPSLLCGSYTGIERCRYRMICDDGYGLPVCAAAPVITSLTVLTVHVEAEVNCTRATRQKSLARFVALGRVEAPARSERVKGGAASASPQ
ncbi:MAG: hypothetical protein JWM10_5221 [Myxococcaceae bacterium]|nr:hypothetical protein [Myxococcaceae bacterium]